MNEQQEGNRQQEKRGVSLTVLDLISRQSSLSCETKLFARLWKDLVFTAAGASVDLGDPFSQGDDLLANLLPILSQRTSAITSTSAGSFFSCTTLRAR